MTLPALVTTSPAGTPAATAGVLGQPTTTVLFGGNQTDPLDHAGGRFRFGIFFDCTCTRSIEFDYFLLDGANFGRDYIAPTNYDILARPFYNTFTGMQDAEFVGFPGLVDGTVGVRTTTDFRGGGVLYRYNLLCSPNAGCGFSFPTIDNGFTNSFQNFLGQVGGVFGGVGGYLPYLAPTRVDGLIGYRAYELDEFLVVNESLTSTEVGGAVPVGTTIDIQDSFHTENTFHGATLGLDNEWAIGRWGFGADLKVSLGELQRRAVIRGSTTTTLPALAPTTADGGLLALPSNIGRYRDDQFVAIPEVGFNGFFDLSPSTRLTIGYTLIFVPDTWRPGSIIDTNVDPRQLPPPTVANATDPQFRARSEDFWAQGVTMGMEFRY